jgi:hypothetical protein
MIAFAHTDTPCTDYINKYATEESLRKYCPSTDGPTATQNRLSSANANGSNDTNGDDSESTISDFSEGGQQKWPHKCGVADETQDMEL